MRGNARAPCIIISTLFYDRRLFFYLLISEFCSYCKVRACEKRWVYVNEINFTCQPCFMSDDITSLLSPPDEHVLPILRIILWPLVLQENMHRHLAWNILACLPVSTVWKGDWAFLWVSFLQGQILSYFWLQNSSTYFFVVIFSHNKNKITVCKYTTIY